MPAGLPVSAGSVFSDDTGEKLNLVWQEAPGLMFADRQCLAPGDWVLSSHHALAELPGAAVGGTFPWLCRRRIQACLSQRPGLAPAGAYPRSGHRPWPIRRATVL